MLQKFSFTRNFHIWKAGLDSKIIERNCRVIMALCKSDYLKKRCIKAVKSILENAVEIAKCRQTQCPFNKSTCTVKLCRDAYRYNANLNAIIN